ncbi:hypothetical protein WDW37_02685 [Bdellovibrionota bacterium FG-1]
MTLVWFRAWVLVLFCFLGGGAISQASVDHHAGRGKAKPRVHASELEVTIPQGELEWQKPLSVLEGMSNRSVSSSGFKMTATPTSSAHLEFSTSSWIPESLVIDSMVSNASAFRGAGVPQLSMGFISPAFLVRGPFQVSWIAGLSFLRLKRDAQWTVNGAPSSGIQALDLFPLRAGVEGVDVFSSWFLGFVDLAFCPSLLITERSVLDEARIRGALPLEFSMGLGNDLRWLNTSLRGAQLRVGFLVTSGGFISGDLSGRGVRAGFSFPL